MGILKHHYQRILCVCGFLAFSYLSFAQESISELSVPVKSKSVTFTELQIIGTNTSYIRASQNYFSEGEKPSSLNRLGLNLKLSGKKNGRHMHIDATGFYSFTEGHEYINPREFYVSYPFAEGRIYWGRKKNNWSHLENIWQGGLWQPRFQWNKLRPEHQGLVGAHYNVKKGNFNHTVLLSPFFLPETGPAFSERNGEVVSKNPWFRTPPPVVSVREAKTDLRVSIGELDLENLFVKPGVAYSLIHKKRNTGVWQQASYAYKPMNQVLMGFPYKIKAGEEETFATLELNVRTSYHHLAEYTVGLNKGHFRSWFSVSYEKPEDTNSLPSSWIYQNTSASTQFAGYVGVDIEKGDNGLGRSLYISGLSLNGDDLSDGGERGGDGTQFERRFKFYKSVKVGVSDSIGVKVNKSMRLLSDFSALYDFSQRAGSLLAHLNLKTQSSWNAFLNVDFIGILDGVRPERPDDFLRLYRANDSVELGVSYVY